MDLSELIQYINGISTSVGSAGDKTSTSLQLLQGYIHELNVTLKTTNVLLGIIAGAAVTNVALKFFKR